MEYRNLGGSELRASVVALGGNTFGPPRIDEQATHRVVHAAQDLGINFVDTAIGYGEGESEKYLGTALKGRRDKWLVATKFNFRNRGEKSVREHVFDQCDTSLGKLQTDYIDLYQLHQPSDAVPSRGAGARPGRPREGGQGARGRLLQLPVVADGGEPLRLPHPRA